MDHVNKNRKKPSNDPNGSDSVGSSRSTNSRVIYPAHKISLTNIPNHIKQSLTAKSGLNAPITEIDAPYSDSRHSISSRVTVRKPHSINSNSSDTEEFTDRNEASKKTEQKDYLLLYPPVLFVRAVHDSSDLDPERTKIVLNIDSDIELASPSAWTNVCRICYGTDSFEELIGPCKCRGSVAYAHRSCLERWLKESSRSRCELCRYRYHIIRTPRYSVARALLIWLFYPDEHTKDLVMDFFGFCLYTPTALLATYLLLISCESIRQVLLVRKSLLANLMAFIAISVASLGMASIDFAYSSWLIFRVRKHMESWRRWWLNNCQVTLIIPTNNKRKPNLFAKSSETVPTETNPNAAAAT